MQRGFPCRFPGVKTLPSGYQLRAARSLIGWSQTDLAKASHVDHTTIGRLEKAGDSQISAQPRTLQAIVHALEKAGVEFTDTGVALTRKRSERH
jgi:transcriptional regulator with XRE-family HTH domain